jgi:hypothetical protein
VENAATSDRDIGENTAFTILCAAIAILTEVEYWRSLVVDFAQAGDFSGDVGAAGRASAPQRRRETIGDDPNGNQWRKSVG